MITTLATSTTEVAAPFLLPEMVDRIAAVLNYFLLYLTGPQRKMLKVRHCRTAWWQAAAVCVHVMMQG